MLTICQSTKGGSGTSTVTAGLAALSSRRHRSNSAAACTMVIDTAGDLPTILGTSTPLIGLGEWLTRSTDHDFFDLCIRSDHSLLVMPRGSTAPPDALAPSWNRLAALVEQELSRGRLIYIDCGTSPVPQALVQRVPQNSRRLLLVIRPCYLALHRALQENVHVDGVVLVTGGGRVLKRRDVESVLRIPVVAEVPLDPDIARRVDSGLFRSRLPKSLVTALVPLVPMVES